jgi:uncharacterized membrane protein YuzA (DUF378 family)
VAAKVNFAGRNLPAEAALVMPTICACSFTKHAFIIFPAGIVRAAGMWGLDFSTLILLLFGGAELGLKGAFGFSPVGWLLGPWTPTVYLVIGLAAVWQFFRQKFI